METRASLRGVRLSAQKGRLVADQVRGKPVEAALNILNFSPKKGAKILKKVLESGIRLPMSSIGVDIWGTDVLGNDLFARGDLDGIVEPTGRAPMPLVWGQTPMLFAPMWMRPFASWQ